MKILDSFLSGIKEAPPSRIHASPRAGASYTGPMSFDTQGFARGKSGYGDYYDENVAEWDMLLGDKDDWTSRAQQVSWVFSGIREIASLMSAATLDIVKKDQETYEPVIDHDLERVWMKPGRTMGRSLLMNYWVWSMYLRGEAYLYLSPDPITYTNTSWELGGISLLPAKLIDIVVDRDTGDISAYNFYPKGKDKKQDVERIDAEYVVYSRFPNPDDPSFITGKSPLEACSSPWTLDYEEMKWNISFFGKYAGVPNNIVSVKKELDKVQFQRIQQEMAEFYSGNQQRTMVIRGDDISVEKVMESHRDMDFLGSRDMSRKEIDRILGFPEGYWSEKSNRANSSNARSVFQSGTIWPLLTGLAEDVMAQWPARCTTLDIGGGEIFKFKDIRERDRDMFVREQGMRSKYATINELRSNDNLPPLTGDKYDKVTAAEVIRSNARLEPPAPDPNIDNIKTSDLLDEAHETLRVVDMDRWEAKALSALKKDGVALCEFSSEYIPDGIKTAISGLLKDAKEPSDVSAAFKKYGKSA